MEYNIVVTGSSGFVGQHVTKVLDEVSLSNLMGKKVNVFSLSSKNYDLLFKYRVFDLFNELKPSCIIHMAGVVGGIGANQNNPGKFMFENLSMGLNLIEEARRHNIDKFIMVGTTCSYPAFAPIPFKEEDIYNGYPEPTNAPYGIAKKTLIELCIAYNKQYNFPCVNLIPTNMYGPYDHFNLNTSHVIPAILKKVLEAKEKNTPLTVWGSGEPSRDFLYGGDFAECVYGAIFAKPSDKIINIGSGVETKISEVVNVICDLVDFKGEIIYDTSKPDGQMRRCLDTSRAEEILGFRAKTDLYTGLQKTIKWYMENK